MGVGANTGDLLITDVEIDGQRLDVLVDGGRVAAIGPRLGPAHERVAGEGGALLPGLHDHHIHLAAAAAARDSLDLAQSTMIAREAIRRAARELPRDRWLRVVGYHESMAGDLDRHALDAIVGDRPVRVQHRSGALWILNSRALAALGAALDAAPPGVERDAHGLPTGRCWRMDTWLRDHLAPPVVDVESVARELRGCGITGVTDMTPYERIDEAAPLLDRPLSVRVVVTGSPTLADAEFPPTVTVGPVKILLEDHDPPPFDLLVDWIRTAHGLGRNVAVHCVTRAALALIVAAWDAAGSRHGDRVEHGAVVPPDLAQRLAAHRITVVTQPSFVACRGDDYLRDVDAEDVPHLWPCASLLAAGIPVAASTDAPFGPADPWAAIAAATSRTTASGRSLGAAEAIPAARALEMFLGHPTDPGGPPRRIEVGGRADLCLLDRPLADALAAPSSSSVWRTWVGGR